MSKRAYCGRCGCAGSCRGCGCAGSRCGCGSCSTVVAVSHPLQVGGMGLTNKRNILLFDSNMTP